MHVRVHYPDVLAGNGLLYIRKNMRVLLQKQVESYHLTLCVQFPPEVYDFRKKGLYLWLQHARQGIFLCPGSEEVEIHR